MAIEGYNPDEKSQYITSIFNNPSVYALGKEEGNNPLSVGLAREYNIEKSYSISNLINSDLLAQLPSLRSLKEYKDAQETDLLKLNSLITQLDSDLKGLKGDIQFGEDIVAFSGQVEKDAKLFGDDVFENIDMIRAESLSILQSNLNQESEDYFAQATPGGEATYAWDDTSTKATTSNVLTLGGNYYSNDGFYADRNGVKLEGDTRAPYLRNDGTRLFQNRNDIFEIQQQIMLAGGPAPKRIGFWDEGLASYMENVLAYANDSRSWELDFANGYSDVGQQWRSALGEYQRQYESGTQLAEVLQVAGYNTLTKPGPTEKEIKDSLDALYSNYGLTPTATMYKKDGEFLRGISMEAAAREEQVASGGNYLKELILGTKAFDEIPGENDEGFIEYQKAKADGRVYEDSNGVYIVPPVQQIQEQVGYKEPMDVTGTTAKYLEDRYSKRIGSVEDRSVARENAALFTNNYISLARTGFSS